MMNGELLQLCMLVNGARNAMKCKRDFTFSQDEYINSIEFKFAPRKYLFGVRYYCARDPREWFSRCVQQGISDVKFLAPVRVKDRALLGYANVSSACIVTFYKNKLVTYWTAAWEFDRAIKKWNVKYQEHEWDNAPSDPPQFKDNAHELEDILVRISEFADLIGSKGFGNVFRNARGILRGESEIPEKYPNGKRIWVPAISEKKKRMFFAASIADVFGAMGSWNDDPPYCAHEKGLDKEYETLSDELLKQIRLTALYVINGE